MNLVDGVRENDNEQKTDQVEDEKDVLPALVKDDDDEREDAKEDVGETVQEDQDDDDDDDAREKETEKTDAGQEVEETKEDGRRRSGEPSMITISLSYITPKKLRGSHLNNVHPLSKPNRIWYVCYWNAFGP